MSEQRTLLVTQRRVAAADREAYVAGLRDLRMQCAAAGVQFWAFEQADNSESFLEFAESKDAARFAVAGLGQPPAVAWHSIELT